MVERRLRSRVPLRLILITLFIVCALWLFELYQQPTWGKIRSFVLGYFLGSFVMEWVYQRSSRNELREARVEPREEIRAGTPV